MKKASFSFIFILLFICSFSQINKPEVLNPTGNSFKSTTMMLDWTIGETLITTLSNEPTQITQGFHQPTVIINNLQELPAGIEELNLFPNPATNHATFQTKFAKAQRFELQINSIKGEKLFSKNVQGITIQESLDLSTLAPGLYYLSFGMEGHNYSIPFTIQKSN